MLTRITLVALLSINCGGDRGDAKPADLHLPFTGAPVCPQRADGKPNALQNGFFIEVDAGDSSPWGVHVFGVPGAKATVQMPWGKDREPKAVTIRFSACKDKVQGPETGSLQFPCGDKRQYSEKKLTLDPANTAGFRVQFESPPGALPCLEGTATPAG